MEEIARAAGISRQGLYLYFPSKEMLFKEMVLHSLEISLDGVVHIAQNESLPLVEKITSIFHEWEGRHIVVSGASLWELLEAAYQIAGENLIERQEAKLLAVVQEVLTTAQNRQVLSHRNATVEETAETLRIISRGLLAHCESRKEFLTRMNMAARVVLSPCES